RDPLLGGAVGDSPWRRGTVTQASLALEPVPTDPLTRAADADTSGCCSGRYRPTLLDNQRAEPTTTAPAESGVSVQIHPVTSLGPSLPLTALSLQGGPDEPTSSGTTARHVHALAAIGNSRTPTLTDLVLDLTARAGWFHRSRTRSRSRAPPETQSRSIMGNMV